MGTPSSQAVRPPSAPGPLRWLKKNLFSTWYNALLTVVALVILFFLLRGILGWVFFQANWDPVSQSLQRFAVGKYPAEQLWRVGVILLTISFLFGVSWRVWGGTIGTFALAQAIGLGLVALLPIGLDKLPLLARLWLLGNPLLTLAGLFAGRLVHRPRWVLLGWVLAFILMIILLSGIPGLPWLPPVESGQWGGLLLTFLLAVVGIVACFPIGVLLALGRRSSLPVVKVFCTLFIELVRGVPLVTILFMFSLILPLFLPEQVRIDRVLRAMMAMTFFASVYMAENVRGGLQAVSQGQIEAARALGLTNFQVTRLIVLPQALRTVIPAIVGQFIALFMDTTLAYIIGLSELLTTGREVLQSRREWLLLDMEVFIFIAALFWVFTYAMSYASRRLEAALGVGQR
jgi:general L-amino acid transport system permease protein